MSVFYDYSQIENEIKGLMRDGAVRSTVICVLRAKTADICDYYPILAISPQNDNLANEGYSTATVGEVLREIKDKSPKLSKVRRSENPPLESRLALFRRNAGLTQAALAARAGITQSSYNNYEYGIVPLEKAAAGTVLAIAKALGVTVEDLLD